MACVDSLYVKAELICNSDRSAYDMACQFLAINFRFLFVFLKSLKTAVLYLTKGLNFLSIYCLLYTSVLGRVYSFTAKV